MAALDLTRWHPTDSVPSALRDAARYRYHAHFYRRHGDEAMARRRFADARDCLRIVRIATGRTRS